MRKLFTLFTVVLLAFYANVFAQQSVIRGKVTDSSNGEALPGVSVLVKGTTNGTQTDANGNYSINAPSDGTLVFSYIGYQNREIPVNKQTTINASIQSLSQELTQVVVVGYGTQKKRDVTGSVASVKGADIAKQPVTAATQAIQGKVAGVQIIGSGDPNANPTVRVRGTGSMLGGANPLYVVDGVITDDIRNINSADIVSMEVLKDASSTAIYGMRAANGVLIITTKKGKTGKMQVSYDANMGIREAANLVNMAGAKQYAGYVNEASVYYGSGDELVTQAQLQAGANTDWYDVILRKGFQQNHNLSLSGGTNKATYFLSAGYLSDEGIIQTNKFNRFTLRSNNEYKFNDSLKVSAMISYSRYDVRQPNLDVFNQAYRAAPYVPSKINGKYGNTSTSNNVGNPLLDLEKRNDGGIGDRFQGTFALDYNPVSWLALRSSLGTDLGFLNFKTYDYQYDNAGPNNVFITSGGAQLRQNSSLRVEQGAIKRWVWDNTATMSKKFGLHNLGLLLGVTAEKLNYNRLVGTRVGVPENKDQWFLGAGASIGATNDNTGDKWTRNSYLSRLTYSYDDRYLLTATFRVDGTSRFPKDNRWGSFPSIGLGWNIANEQFMKSQNLFNTLKLRGSWGRVGNDQIATNVFYSIAAINQPYFFNGKQYSGIAFDQLPDKNVKWETTEEYDLGLDLGLFNNRLTAEMDYYSKKTNDALINIVIPAILGDKDNLYTTNAASFINRGVEFGANWSDKIGKNWSYNIGGNIAYNKNKITDLSGGQALIDGSIGGYSVTKSDNNQPIGSFYLLQADGIFQTAAEISASAQKDAKPGDLRYKDLSGANGTPDGKIDDYDRAFSGSYQPKLTFGINGGVSYKDLDLSIGMYGTAGGKIYNGKKAARPSGGDNIETEVAKNRWTPNNTNTGIPRANLNQLPASTYFLEKGDFFRINNLTLGYTLPSSVLSKYKIQRFRLYVTVQNLATITGYSGFTPELMSEKPLNAGIESAIYPTTRTFSFGINFGF